MSTAIESGVLAPGARLPSWQDLAAQLGVARGTVRAAYEKLSAAQLIVASRATGTHVAERPRAVTRSEQPPDPGSFMEMYQEMTQGPAIFQMGVPAAGDISGHAARTNPLTCGSRRSGRSADLPGPSRRT